MPFKTMWILPLLVLEYWSPPMERLLRGFEWCQSRKDPENLPYFQVWFLDISQKSPGNRVKRVATGFTLVPESCETSSDPNSILWAGVDYTTTIQWCQFKCWILYNTGQVARSNETIKVGCYSTREAKRLWRGYRKDGCGEVPRDVGLF